MNASQTAQKALAILKAKSNFKDCNSLVDTVTREYFWDTWMMAVQIQRGKGTVKTKQRKETLTELR